MDVKESQSETHAQLKPAILRRLTTQNAQPSVRIAVLNLLTSERRAFSTDETAQSLRGHYLGMDDNRFRANVRSALYQLKVSGEVKLIGRATYISSKWDESSNTESPASTGLSGASDPVIERGDGANGTDTHRVRDDDSFWTTDHREHDLGAPVMGA